MGVVSHLHKVLSSSIKAIFTHSLNVSGYDSVMIATGEASPASCQPLLG